MKWNLKWTAVAAAALLCLLLSAIRGEVLADGYTARVLATSLNVRSEPAASAPVQGSLKQGSQVTVLDEQFGWMKVRHGSTTGWVAGYYLTRTGAAPSNAKAVSGSSAGTSKSVPAAVQAAGTARVTADSLRVRGGPGTGYAMTGSLRSGDSVSVERIQNGWAQITLRDGGKGWVSAQYLASSGSTAGTDRQASSPANAISAGPSASSSASLKGKLIVIDPGHGGSDPGMVGKSLGTLEKDLTLQTSLYLRDYLAAKGARVEMTRTRDDQRPSLPGRVALGHQLGADAFVSIHYNSATKPVSGTLTFYHSGTSGLKLARAIEGRLGPGVGLKNNGVSFGDYHVLRENRVPAALVELGFLSHPGDESLVRTAAYQKRAAQAVADGIADYFK